MGIIGLPQDTLSIRLNDLVNINGPFTVGSLGTGVAGQYCAVYADPVGTFDSILQGPAGTVLTSGGPGVPPYWAAGAGSGTSSMPYAHSVLRARL